MHYLGVIPNLIVTKNSRKSEVFYQLNCQLVASYAGAHVKDFEENLEVVECIIKNSVVIKSTAKGHIGSGRFLIW